MKRKLALLMAAVLMISLVLTGCGGGGGSGGGSESAGNDSGSSGADSGGDAASSDKPLAGKTVGFAQTDSMSAWRTTETDSIKEYVENAGGKFIVKDAGGDIATQEADIRDLVAAGVDYLVVAPLEDNGLQGALEEAMLNDIPTILVDRAITGDAGTYFTTAIMSDFFWEGAQCADALMEALPDGANIVIIHGGLDSSTSTDRRDGFVNELDAKGYNYTLVAEQNGNWLMADAQDVMASVIQSNGGDAIDAVFCVTDDMTQGAMNAIREANLTPGTDILTLGIDGTRAAFEAVQSGDQLASCTCSPYFGPIVVETITKIMNGETVDTHITNEDTLYTKDNVVVELGF